MRPSSQSMYLDALALVSTPLYTHQLPLASLALAGGYAADAMTRPDVLSLSLRMTFSIRPREDKEIPQARAAQALLTLPPPLQGYFYYSIHESPTAGPL